jgi:peptidoglycan/LPS O-acetylase OafA/YrhL
MITKKVDQISVSQNQRSDIQVLRGIAVLAVVFYHLGFPIYSGFLGVDVFFVISGYVITGTILRASGTLKNTIIQFYKKRIRRLFPTSTYIITLALFATFLFLPRVYISKYINDAVSSFFMISNFRFAYVGVDYLQDALETSPFLHFWSLGVEEQFYLLWPIALLTLFRRKALYNFAIPAFFSLYAITPLFYPTAYFFFPTSRAWEFLVGAFVASIPKYNVKNILKYFIQIASLISIIVAMLATHSAISQTLLFTLLTVLATGSLIYVGFSTTLLKPLEYVGNLSYSLYLIHWPIVAILSYYHEKFDTILRFSIFLSSLIFSIILTKNFENPIRLRQKYLKSRKFWATLLVPIFALTLFAQTNGFKFNQQLPYELNISAPIIYSNGCYEKMLRLTEPYCDFGDLNSQKIVILVGDSHAAQWFPGFDEAGKASGFKLQVATKNSCAAILPLIGDSLSNPACNAWRKDLIQFINLSKPKILVISNLTEKNGSPEVYISSLKNFIEHINTEIKITIIGDTPYPRTNSVTCLSINWENPEKCNIRNIKSFADEISERILDSRTNFVDPSPYLCSDLICPAVIDGVNVFRDASHLSLGTVKIQKLLAEKVLNSQE